MTTIYCFSGTGNSLKSAKDIAFKLGYTNIVQVTKATMPDSLCGSQNIGFVFPVYSFGLPVMMAKFIKKLKVTSENPYFFACATYRDKPGGAIVQLGKILKSKGFTLSAGFNIWMPGNYLLVYDADDDELQEKKFKQYEEGLDDKIQIIKSRQSKPVKTDFKQRFIQFGILYPVMAAMFRQMDRLFWVDESCNGCSVCARVCPAGNISIKDNRPVFHHKCEQCSACINWCPSGALQCTKKTIGKKRYHHPEIKLNEMPGLKKI